MKKPFPLHIIHRQDFYIAILLYLITLLFSLAFEPTYLLATVIIFGIPSCYLLTRIKHNRLHIAFFSLIFGTLIGFFVEMIGVSGDAWHVQQVIPFRILGIGYWEDIVWGIFYVLFVIVFYKHFIERDYQVKIHKNVWKLLLLFVFTDTIIFLLILSNLFPSFSYSYLWIGLLIVFPFFLYLYIFHNRLLKKGFPIYIFLAIASLLYEFTALTIGNYVFAGEYVYAFSYLSQHTLPLEDIILWMTFTAPVLVGMYEYFLEGHG